MTAPDPIGPQCQSESAFYSYEQQLLPNACLSGQLIPTSGHSIQEEIAAPLANIQYLYWIDATLGNGTTC